MTQAQSTELASTERSMSAVIRHSSMPMEKSVEDRLLQYAHQIVIPEGIFVNYRQYYAHQHQYCAKLYATAVLFMLFI